LKSPALRLEELQLLHASILTAKISEVHEAASTTYHQAKTTTTVLTNIHMNAASPKTVYKTWLRVISGAAAAQALKVVRKDDTSST
jgi:hypothetical protein